MNFTDILFLETKEYHKQVDKHHFTYLIKNNKNAGDLYINFNKLCIYNIFKTLKIKDNILYNKLEKQFNFNLPTIKISDNFNTLLLKCQEFPLEHSYMFILGLISGGNILKKYILTEHHTFLTFEKNLSKDFKYYLNNSIIDQKTFIQNVKNSYILIKSIFDEFVLYNL